MTTRSGSGLTTAIVLMMSLLGCSHANKDGTDGTDNTHPGYVVNGSSGGSNAGGSGGIASGSDALARCLANPAICASVSSPGPTCAAEVCDGLDNDCNGIIDDVDTGHDGVCDCITIATLGTPGTWGQGDVFGTWLSSRANNGAKSLGNQVLTPDLLKPYMVIVVQNVNANLPSDNSGGIGRVYSQDEIKALADWVNNGGGLMTLIGFSDPSELSNANSILGQFGANYGSKQILQKTNGVTVAITNWFAHPTTVGITQVGVDNGYEAQSAQNAGTVVASQSGYNVGRALDSGQGRVFQWGDEWITYNSEWTQHPDYQVQLFWVNILKWLTPSKVCQVAIPPVLIN